MATSHVANSTTGSLRRGIRREGGRRGEERRGREEREKRGGGGGRERREGVRKSGGGEDVGCCMVLVPVCDISWKPCGIIIACLVMSHDLNHMT